MSPVQPSVVGHTPKQGVSTRAGCVEREHSRRREKLCSSFSPGTGRHLQTREDRQQSSWTVLLPMCLRARVPMSLCEGPLCREGPVCPRSPRAHGACVPTECMCPRSLWHSNANLHLT